VIAGPLNVHPHVAAIGPTQVCKRLSERSEASLPHGIVFIERHEHADAPHAVALLRARRVPPRRQTGNRRLRRILVQCAWSYEFPPRVAREFVGFIWAVAQAVRATAAATNTKARAVTS